MGNGKFAVVGDRYGRTSSSADGINWTPVKQESGIGVTYGNGKYVSVGNGSISVSATGGWPGGYQYELVGPVKLKYILNSFEYYIGLEGFNEYQILETHLGWAARALGMQIEAGAEGLADRFEKAGYDVEKYGMPETVEIDKFGEESIKAMKMSVPVFDGAHDCQLRV